MSNGINSCNNPDVHLGREKPCCNLSEIHKTLESDGNTLPSSVASARDHIIGTLRCSVDPTSNCSECQKNADSIISDSM